MREDETQGVEEEYVPADDRIIGVAFRRSLAAILAVAVLAGLVYLLAGRTEAPAPEQVIEAAAPEAVTTVAEAPAVPFADVAAEAGVDFVHDNGAYGDKLLPETMGGGVAFLDHDGDGDEDLLLVNSGRWPHHRYAGSPPTMALYANDGGRFRDVTREAGLDASFYGMGAAAADYDADGDADVFLTAVGANRLYRNDGGSFTDVTAAAGVAGGDDEWSTSAGFFDYDGDGDLDLLVLNYVRWSKEIDFELDFRLTGVGRAFGPPQNYQGTYPYLYRNDGPGVGDDGPPIFTEVAAEAGLHVDNPATGLPMAKSLALGIVDVEGDGDLDVLVANDTVQNFFFHNRGDGRFVEAGERFGVAYDRNGNASGAMGVDAAYYRNDHNLGFLIGNFANEMSSIYVAQDNPGFFVDEAIGEGIGAPSRLKLTFGVLLFDFLIGLFGDRITAVGGRHAGVNGDVEQHLLDVVRRRPGVAGGADVHCEFLPVPEGRQQGQRQQAARRLVESRPCPDRAPGALRDVALEILVERGLARLGAVHMGVAQHRAARLHALVEFVLRQGRSPRGIR